MGAYRALSDSIRELNSMLIGQQQFDGEMKVRHAQMQMEQADRIDKAKDRALNRELVQHKVDQIRKYETPDNFTMYSLTNPDMMSRPRVQSQISEILGGDVEFDLASGVPMKDGKPMQMSPKMVDELAPLMQGVFNVYDLSLQTAQENAALAEQQIADQEFIIKENAKGTDVAALQAKSKALKTITELRKHKNQMDYFGTPAGQMDYYQKKQNDLEQRAFRANAMGRHKTAQFFTLQATEAADLKKRAQGAVLSGVKAKDLVRQYFHDKKTGDEDFGWIRKGEKLTAQHGYNPEIHNLGEAPVGLTKGEKGPKEQTINEVHKEIERDWESGMGPGMMSAAVRPSMISHKLITDQLFGTGEFSPRQAKNMANNILGTLEESYLQGMKDAKDFNTEQLQNRLLELAASDQMKGADPELIEDIKAAATMKSRRRLREFYMNLVDGLWMSGMDFATNEMWNPYTPNIISQQTRKGFK
jgi:hypothetical protein